MKCKGVLLELPWVRLSKVKRINLNSRNRTCPFPLSSSAVPALELELLTHSPERDGFGNLVEPFFCFWNPSKWGRKVHTWAQQNLFKLSLHSSQLSVFRPLTHLTHTCLIPLDLAFWDWRESKILGRLFQVRRYNTQFWRNMEQPWSFTALGLVKCPFPHFQLQLHNQKIAPSLLKTRLSPLTSQ